jgi:uncharacterized membrane protein YphA (DoxX/SURF4 family)
MLKAEIQRPEPKQGEALALRDYASLALRLALGVTFLYSVADRFGILGPTGTPNVSWGSFVRFTNYVGVLNWFVPRPLLPSLAWVDTTLEIVVGIALIVGFRLRLASNIAALLLLAFAATMSIALGIGAPFAYSVFTASAAAFMLACAGSSRWSIDRILAGK